MKHAVALALAVIVSGCQPARSTRLRVDDFDHMAAGISADLGHALVDGFLADRGPGSPPMIIAIERVTDYSHDMLSESEKGYLMARIRDALSHELRTRKNVVFVIPAEHLRAAQRSGADDAFPERAPTHVMHGVLRTVVRTTTLERTDAYLFDCELVDLAAGETVWTATVEFKRAAHGKAWD